SKESAPARAVGEEGPEGSPTELRSDVARCEHDEHHAPEPRHDSDAELGDPVGRDLPESLFELCGSTGGNRKGAVLHRLKLRVDAHPNEEIEDERHHDDEHQHDPPHPATSEPAKLAQT